MSDKNMMSPSEILDVAPMKFQQWVIGLLCLGLMALDGYDVLSISFAAPGLTEEWGLSKAALGVLLPLELLGIAFGSIGMGLLADNNGRRPITLLSLVMVTIGMLAAAIAPNVYILGAARIFTGIGVGGMLATVTATASDFCNAKNRAFVVVLVAGGYSFGIYLGATFLSPLLKQFDWRITFYLGAACSAIFIPLVYFFVPETISYLTRKRPKNALEKIRKIFATLGHSKPETLGAPKIDSQEKISPFSLFKPGIAIVTTIMVIAYFGNIATYYYFVKWLPTIATDIGYSKSEASSILGMISLGGVFGSIGVSIVSRFMSIKPLMIAVLILSGIGVAVFPYFAESLVQMKIVGFATGLCIFGAISGFFGLWAISFPPKLLGAGTGLVLGIGRGGAILGPFVPGLLFTIGLGFKSVAIIMAIGSLLAGIVVIFLPRVKATATAPAT